jgi:hypothetical protein
MAATGDTLWTNQSNAGGEGAFLERWTLGPGWTHHEPNSLPPSEVTTLDLNAQGTVWIGTRLGGVARLTNGVWCTYNGNDPIVRSRMTDSEGHVSALLAARNGSVWFHALPQPEEARAVDLLTASASCDHQGDSWDHIAIDEHGFGGRYQKIVEDGEGNVFLLSDGDASPAASSGGIDAVSADGTGFLNIRNALAGPAVGALAFETEAGPWSNAYVGLNGLQNDGLYLWFRGGALFPPQPPPASINFSRMALPDSLDIGQYRDLVVTPGAGHRIWAATENGIFEYDVDRRSIVTGTLLRTKVDGRAGLLAGDVKDLQFDDFGNLWVATVKGLNRIRLAEREAGVPLTIDAFTTAEVIRELNSGSSVGQIYDPKRALAPLPAAKVNALAYDSGRDQLHAATEAGTAIIDVQSLFPKLVIPLSDAVVWPNPVRLGHDEVRLANVSEPATVSIYTLEGELVCEVGEREDGDVIWTLGTPSCLESEGNFRAASGAYLVRITTSAGSAMRTLVVIR